MHDYPTLREESECVRSIQRCLSLSPSPVLRADVHIAYLMSALQDGLPTPYTSLDASRPWLFFWILRSLQLLSAVPQPGSPLHSQLVKEILELQDTQYGGFRGNDGHYTHLAASYAACAALKILGGLSHVDKEKMRMFISVLRISDGAFMVQRGGGEKDLRGSYCAVAIAKMLEICDSDLVPESVISFIASCQRYEGGLAAVPGAEAHGGYTYCGVAALAILGQLDAIDCQSALRFVTRMQCKQTGGFRGRTNKLPDGCYSFWQGAAARILINHSQTPDCIDWAALERFIQSACQAEKGLRDKPGKSADLYHTCYCLSGLSLTRTANITKDGLLFNAQ